MRNLAAVVGLGLVRMPRLKVKHVCAAAMEERLGYTQRMLARHQKTTIIPEPGIGNQNRSNNAYFNRKPAGPESDDVAAQNGSNSDGAVVLPVGVSLPSSRAAGRCWDLASRWRACALRASALEAEICVKRCRTWLHRLRLPFRLRSCKRRVAAW
jgi:hypothetical protein